MLEFEFMQIDYGDISSPAEKRKIEHSVAYSLLQKMLSSHKITDYEISRNENGKPYITSILHGNSYTIGKGERFAQMRLVETPKAYFVKTEGLESTERGEGGFGSTGTN